jgi:hypothetical protein
MKEKPEEFPESSDYQNEGNMRKSSAVSFKNYDKSRYYNLIKMRL